MQHLPPKWQGLKREKGSIIPRVLKTRIFLATEISLKSESHNPFSSCISDNYFWFAYLLYIEAEDELA